MPRGNFPADKLDMHGFGHQGYCKLCSLKDPRVQAEYNERVKAKWSPRQLNEWATQKGLPELVASKTTVYNHRVHVMHPRDALVTSVQRSQNKALQSAPQTTPDAFLDALVSIGHKKAIENPEEVSIDHALRAASTLKQSREKQGDGINVLIALFTGKAARPSDVIEGQAVEVD